jgi:hypothetical protein
VCFSGGKIRKRQRAWFDKLTTSGAWFDKLTTSGAWFDKLTTSGAEGGRA